jgi:hypothetical protein
MKYLAFSFILFFGLGSNAQSWEFVGDESFSGPNCNTVKIANSGPQLALVTDHFSQQGAVVLPYLFDGTDWNIYFDTIWNTSFSTNYLTPDIDMNSTNEHFILTYGGPNKSYLYQTDLANQLWELVDSIGVNHDDLETGEAGNMLMSGYAGIYEHEYGTGAHNTFSYPSLYSYSKLTVDDNFTPISMHASNSNSFKVSSFNGVDYTTMDSLNYSAGLVGYDTEMSDNKLVQVHLEATSNKIILYKEGLVDWDTIYVDPSEVYTQGEVYFNLAVNAANNNIYVAVNKAVSSVSGPATTTQTIEVFEVSADLLTSVSLGTVSDFTYNGGNNLRDFDLEYKNSKLYCAYVSFEDSSKVSVKTYDMSAGIDKNEALSFDVYPNPTKGLFHLRTDGLAGQVSILDLTGKTLSSSTFVNAIELDASDLPNGIYLLKVVSDAGVYGIKKLVVQNK